MRRILKRDPKPPKSRAVPLAVAVDPDLLMIEAHVNLIVAADEERIVTADPPIPIAEATQRRAEVKTLAANIRERLLAEYHARKAMAS